MRLKSLVLAVASIGLTACWHVTVTSGAPLAPTVVDKQWQNSFILGLVPPPELDVKGQCANGVAQVETEHSFLNVLATVLTFDIYTPIHAKVTCASRR